MSNKQIPVTRSSMPTYEEYTEEIRKLWDSRWLTNAGAEHQTLERNLCEYLGIDNISLFANGHLALELAINATGLTGEAITTPYTFASTTQAIVRNGLTPVFCDIKPDDFTINPDKIEALITDKTSAIIPVHVYGGVCDVYAIQKIADKYGLKVIYDAAHVFGVKLDGVPIGNFGDMSMFSFHATKVFHTVEGGGIVCRDPAMKQHLEELRQFGMRGKEEVPIIGTNAKMTEVHAAMGVCNLRHVDGEIAKRSACVKKYREMLSGVHGIRLMPNQKGVTPNYAYFPVVFDVYKYNRNEIADRLAAENIYARKYFYPITNTFDAYRGLFPIQETPIAQHTSECVLTLPLYADLDVSDVERICRIILN